MSAPHQVLRWLPGHWVIDNDLSTDQDASILWVANAPEGRTIVRAASGGETNHWIAMYGDATAHALDVPGMLLAILTPLASVGCPVFVASTSLADLVLVPSGRQAEVQDALAAAGHSWSTPDSDENK